MFGAMPAKPVQRSLANSNEGGVFGSQPSTNPTAASGPLNSIFQQGGGNFFLNQQTRLNVNDATTAQIRSNNSPLGQGQPQMSFTQSGNLGPQGMFGQQQTNNVHSALAGGRQEPANFGANAFGLPNSMSQNNQQPSFVKGGLFHQTRPGEDNSPNQVYQEKVSHGQYTALSLGLFGQSLDQASNPLGIYNQDGSNKGDGMTPFFGNQQSSMFPNTAQNISPYQTYFDSAQKKPIGGFTIDPKQTQFTLPSLLPTKEAPKFSQLKPVKTKNAKLSTSELVLCISAYEQYSKLCKQQVRILYIKSGGIQPSLSSQQKYPQNNNKTGFGLSSLLSKGESNNKANGNYPQSQPQVGLFGNQTTTPAFFNQSNPQMANIALPNQLPQTFPHNFGTPNPYNQSPLPSLFGAQANNSISPLNYGGVDFAQENNQLAFQSQFNPNISQNPTQNNQAWAYQTQSSQLQFPQFRPQARQNQYSSEIGYIPDLNIHLSPEQIKRLLPQQELILPIYHQSNQKAMTSQAKKTYGRQLMRISAAMARINAFYPKNEIERELHHNQQMGNYGHKNFKALYQQFAYNNDSFTYGYHVDVDEQKARKKVKACYFVSQPDTEEVQTQPKPKKKIITLQQQPKLTPFQIRQKKQDQFLEFLPKVGKFSTFPSIQRLKLYPTEQLKQMPHFKIWNEFGSIEFREPISIFQANLQKHITIAQDSIQITDYYLQTKRHWMTFVDLGNYTKKRPEEQKVLKKKIRGWVEQWRMKEILHDGHNGNLIVEPPVLPNV